jgi:hypothetical protein
MIFGGFFMLCNGYSKKSSYVLGMINFDVTLV